MIGRKLSLQNRATSLLRWLATLVDGAASTKCAAIATGIGKLATLTAFFISLTTYTTFAAIDHGTWVETTSTSSYRGPRPKWTELNCLAQAIYFEARGESQTGQFAVGRVVLNRVDSNAYPDTICGVVYQNAELANRCQFSFACDGKPQNASEREAWRDALDRAEKLADCAAACPDGSPFANPLWNSTHFHADSVNPAWASKMESTGKTGHHLFYRNPLT